MSATIPVYRRPRELSASDGFGPLTPPPQPRCSPPGPFCLDAATHWRAASPSIASAHPAASALPASTGVPAAPEGRNIPL